MDLANVKAWIIFEILREAFHLLIVCEDITYRQLKETRFFFSPIFLWPETE